MNAKAKRRLCGGIKESAGMTLLEIIGYTFILSILVGLCLQVFLGSTRLAAVGGAAVDRIEGLAAIQTEFRQAVRESAGVAASAAGFESTESQAVLSQPDGERFIVFGMPDGTQQLCKRTIRVKDGAWDLEGAVSYPVELSGLRFTYSGGAPATSRGVTLHATAAGRAKDNRVGKDVTVAATCRGTQPAEGHAL